MTAFTSWLSGQAHREDEVGDLACDLEAWLDGFPPSGLAESIAAITTLLAGQAPDIAVATAAGPLRTAISEYTAECTSRSGSAAVAAVRREQRSRER